VNKGIDFVDIDQLYGSSAGDDPTEPVKAQANTSVATWSVRFSTAGVGCTRARRSTRVSTTTVPRKLFDESNGNGDIGSPNCRWRL